ncbi:Acg family FMN-binding oxidoreductase [Metabacillus fastidiosus]|uniref:Acg family FMN-binding oxidoreductase n=1 Tax=Metabacillus fastidiosus TaxID=1458 RepID=UPI003D2ACAD1
MQVSEKISRRSFIKRTSAAIFVLAAGGTMWRAFDQGVFSTGKGEAYKPWSTEAVSWAAGPLLLVHYAILASNPHNTQPWLFKITDSYIDLFADEERNLGTIDPLRREMFIGIGCALENLTLAAQANGYIPRIDYFPSNQDNTYVARVHLDRGEKKISSLFEIIKKRHTHRGAYDTAKVISPNLLTELQKLSLDEKNVNIKWFTSNSEKQSVGEAILSATKAITEDEEMSTDSHKWFRNNWDEIQEKKDGLTLDAQGASSWIRAMGKILPTLSRKQSDDFWLKSTKEIYIKTAAAYGLLSVQNAEDRQQRVRLGRVWQRLHLHGTSKGLAMHPLNQINEMADRETQLNSKRHFRNKLKELVGHSDWNGLFIFRLGYPLEEVHISPRREIKNILI